MGIYGAKCICVTDSYKLSKLDEAFEVIAELQNLLKGAQNTARQHPAVPGSAEHL